MKSLKFSILAISIFVGFAMVLQFRSFQKVESLRRERPSNIFQQIETLRAINERLQQEKEELKKKIEESVSNVSRFQALQKELEKNRLLSGEISVSGEGVILTFEAAPDTFWMTDLLHVLARNGAEAVALSNGHRDIRLLPGTAGLRSFPTGEILLRRFFLAPPLKMKIIGDQEVLASRLLQPGGILSQIEKKFPKSKITLQRQDAITISAFSEEES